MKEQKNKKTVAVMGAGPGGYGAAFKAADLGLEVTLIDPEPNPGGVCLYRGCIPTKALLHIAQVITEVNHVKEMGLSFSDVTIDLDTIRSWKDKVVADLTKGVGFLSKQRKITYIRGTGVFKNSHTLKIDKHQQGGEELSFDSIILATGTYSAPIPNINLKSDRIWDSTQALNLKTIPKTMLVIGGGYIGLELGTVFNALGTEVSLVEMTEGLLPGMDRDLVSVYQREAKNQFKAIRLNTQVSEIKEQTKGLKVRLEGKKGEKEEKVYEIVLMAVGRKPNTKGLGLEHTRVEIDDKGFVQVDAQRRTKDSAIFAVGDITGPPLLAHKATHEGQIAARAIAGFKDVFHPKAIPAVEYTHPEIAWCGLSETQAKKEDLKITIVKFPWTASGRAATLNQRQGLTKLILEPETGQILGVGIAGYQAGELIAEGVLAVEMGARAEDLAHCIHPHPTLSETLMEAAESFKGQSIHYYGKK